LPVVNFCNIDFLEKTRRSAIVTESPKTHGNFASSPCFAHEVTASAEGFSVVDAQTETDVARWRKAERIRLLAERKSFSRSDIVAAAKAVTDQLDRFIHFRPGIAISVYWPIRAELDLRDWMRTLAERDAKVLLPVITERGRPIRFFTWTPDCRMVAGFWNIPVPENGEEMAPDVSIVPVVGYDSEKYRLGYGGGYFDRTLASLKQPPVTYGIGHRSAEVPTIFPQPHDIPMDHIVTA